MALSKNTLRGFYIVITVITIANITILWMLIPNMPGSFLMLALPSGALRIVHSLAFSLAALQGFAVSTRIFFWYHLIFVLIPLACVAGLLIHSDIARKVLLVIACLNSGYWLFLILKSLWRGCLDYGPALIVSVLYIIYLNDQELKDLFKKPIK